MRRPFSLLAPTIALVAVLLAPVASAQTQSDVELKDQLIARQENLLNTYRCFFGVDTHVVPGSCPNPDVIAPGPAPANPTHSDINARDRLIQGQEALLTIYRCQLDVASVLRPRGCPGHISGPYIGLDWEFRFWELFSIELTDGPYVEYRLFGEDDSQFFLRGRPNLLAIHCNNGTELSVYIIANKSIPDEPVQASFNIDGTSTPITEQWSIDRDLVSDWGPVVFPPDSSGFVNFLSRYGTGTLSVSMSTGGGRTTWWDADFIVDGANAVIESLRQECRA